MKFARKTGAAPRAEHVFKNLEGVQINKTWGQDGINVAASIAQMEHESRGLTEHCCSLRGASRFNRKRCAYRTGRPAV